MAMVRSYTVVPILAHRHCMGMMIIMTGFFLSAGI